MKSQKQSNKSPRPFKNNNSARDWSGGSGSQGFIPGGKPAVRTKKVEDTPPKSEK